MPKGDRLKLKADPEDGTTPIANLLLEAVAMAKITGLQKGAILYLWRRTYGWVEDGQRVKERKITLTEWKYALDSSPSRLSKALSSLETSNIIERRMADAWGGYYYKINTNISSWDSGSINLAKLSERVGVVDFATVDQNATLDQKATINRNDNSGDKVNSLPKRNATVDQNATQQLTKTQLPTLYKERLNKDKESIIRGNENNKTGIIYKLYDENFRRITETTRETLNDYIDNYGDDNVVVALSKAIKQGKCNLAYVEGILKGSGKDRKSSRAIPKHEDYKEPEDY